MLKTLFRPIVGFGAAGALVSVASVWLWGASASAHMAALSDTARIRLLGAEPHAVRAQALNHQIDAAAEESVDMANLISQFDGDLASTDKTLGELQSLQNTDENLLRKLDEKLGPAEGGNVTINGREFTKSEIEADAEAILHRHKQRAEEIADLKRHRDEQQRMRAELQANLTERLGRLRQAQLGQKQIERLVQLNRFADRLAGIQSTLTAGHALEQVEVAQHDILRDLRSKSSAHQVIRRVKSAGDTPVADALKKANQAPLADRIKQVVAPALAAR